MMEHELKYHVWRDPLTLSWQFAWRDGFVQTKRSWQEAIDFANYLILADYREIRRSARS